MILFVCKFNRFLSSSNICYPILATTTTYYICHGQNEDARVCEKNHEIIDEWPGIPYRQLCRNHTAVVIHIGAIQAICWSYTVRIERYR